VKQAAELGITQGGKKDDRAALRRSPKSMARVKATQGLIVTDAFYKKK